jgi:hypothetical protein
MNGNSQARFKDAPWFHPYAVTIGGVGGIGSWVAMLMARMGHELYLYDMDRVEQVNLGGQLYGISHINMDKTAATKQVIKTFCDHDAVHTFSRFEDTTEGTAKMISCFDNMEARRIFFNAWNKYRKETHTLAVEAGAEQHPCLFIDGRLEAETAIIYCVRNDAEAELWQKEWFPDTNVPDAPCTFRATSHNAAIIAGFMTAVFNNVITNHREDLDCRVVPWKTTYELPTMTFESKELPPA